MPYLLGFQINTKLVLAIGEGSGFKGSDALSEAMKLLPDYNAEHGLGYTHSMSACIHWMQFSPMLFFFTSFDDLKFALLDSKIYNAASIVGRIKYTHFKDDYKPEVAYSAKLVEVGAF